MPSSSGNFSFNSINAELIIRKAFELIRFQLSLLTAEQYNSALQAVNFVLSDWSNSNVNLWTLKLGPVFLTQGQAAYTLPSNISKVFQVFLRSNTRQNFGGTPISNYGGTPANAFDGNPTTYCEQVQENGYIGYTYSSPKIIKILGVQSNKDAEYSLTFSGLSADQMDTYYEKIIPKTLYKKGVTQWFLLDDSLSACPYYQIEETGGAVLDISELYFNTLTQDTLMSEVSRYEYLSYPNKALIGRPTIYYVDYQRTPLLYIWQTPSPMYNLIMYSGQSSIETVESYTEGIDIPSYFYTPLIYGVAEILAQQYAPEHSDRLALKYQENLAVAVTNNTTEVPLKLGVSNG